MKNLSKKITTLVASLALVVILGFTLTACGSKGGYSGLSYDQYKENLAKAGYEAQSIKEGDEGWDQYKESFVSEYTDDADLISKVQWMIMAWDEKEEHNIMLMGVSDKDAANKIYDLAKKAIDKEIEEETNEEEKAKMQNYQVFLADTVLVYGEDQTAIDAAYGKITAEKAA